MSLSIIMSTQDALQIQISLAAMAKMIKFDLSKPGSETIGLLIGHETDGVVFVEDVRLGQQSGNAVHVEINEMELIQAATEISERDDGHVIVGWVHTHPGLSAFLSPTDVRTQSLYQNFMPNSIAIVIDAVKYGKSGNLEDLDLKVFRIINNQAQPQRYTFTKTVEFGLNTFITGEAEVKVHGPATPRFFQVKVPNKQIIRSIKGHLQKNEEYMEPQDVQAIRGWLELIEAIESGDVKEVPVEVDSLMTKLEGSIGTLNDELISMRQELELKKVQNTLFTILIGVILEFAAFYFLLFR